MMIPLPPPPQTGRQPELMSSAAKANLLARKAAGDTTDPFAADANEAVRELGRLALRRESTDPSDFFALGDLCAKLSLQNDRLLILYVGKALQAYRRAGQVARKAATQTSTTAPQRDLALSESAVQGFVRWVMEIASSAIHPRNIAVALWAFAEIAPEQQTDLDRTLAISLARQYITDVEAVTPSADHPTLETTAISEPPTSSANVAEMVAALEVTPGSLTEPEDEALTEDHALRLPPIAHPVPLLGLPQPTPKQAPPAWLSDTGAHSVLTEGGANEVETQDHTDFSSEDPTQRRQQPPVSTPKPDGLGDFAVGDAIRDRDEDRYEVLQVLRGGMGVIYVCYDAKEDRRVAIKTFQSKYLNNDHAQERFRYEARIWIDLEKHPNIVQARKVETFGRQGVRERPHIILEYISGPEGVGSDLKGWVEQKRLTVQTALEIGIDICAGMMHAVQKVAGLVHRDLKPGNILVRHDGVAKVTDFGLVRSLDSTLDTQEMPMILPDQIAQSASPRLTRTGARLGTLAYMSPEQCLARRDLDLRSDIYAFGVILYEMLCERRPFSVRTPEEWFNAHLKIVPAFPPDRAEQLPSALVALTMECLAKQADERPQTWEALRDRLNSIYEGLTGSRREIDTSSTALEIDELMDKAYSLTELGRSAEALTVYDRVVAMQPEPRNLAWALARKGRALRILHQDTESLRYYDSALQLRPEFGWAWYSKAIAHERLKEYDQALNDYAKAALYSPRDVWTVYNHARLLLRLGRAEEALSKIDEALKVNPQHPDSLTQRGWDLLELGRLSDANAAFEAAIGADTKFAPAYIGRGKTEMRLGKYEEAESLLLQAARYAPRDPDAWLTLSEVYVRQGRLSEALSAAKQAAMIRPKYERIWQRIGDLLLRLRRYDEALESYGKVLNLHPNYAPALSGCGVALMYLNRLEEAVAHFGAALQISPERAPYLHSMADALFKLRRYSEARETLETLVQKRPNDKIILARLGKALLRTGEATRALNAYDSSLKVDGNYAWALAGRGATLRALGQLEEAAECYRRAAEADPTRPFRWLDYAGILADLRRYDEALAMLAKVTVPSAESLTLRGKILRHLRQFPEAITAYEAAIALKTDLGWAWNGRGLALQRLKRNEEALTSYEKAMDVMPRNIWPRLNMVEVLAAMHRHEEAVQVADEAIAVCVPLGLAAGMIWMQKGHALRRLFHYDQAILAYDQALAFTPNLAEAWNGKGLAYAGLGKRTEAIHDLTRATQINEKSAWFWYNLGDVLVEHGEYKEALVALKNALDLKRDFNRATRKRDEARRKISKE